MKTFLSLVLGILSGAVAIVIVWHAVGYPDSFGNITPVKTDSPFYYDFNVDGTLEEEKAPEESSSPYWWLGSGGRLIIKDGKGMTFTGALLQGEKWHDIYASTNPRDTDGGRHPQNIFRLVTLRSWIDAESEIHFILTRYNQSDSPNRNGSNGLFLFSRFHDQNNLYYAGLRVDGQAVIKKKQNGVYHTLMIKKVLPGTYNRARNSNLIPTNTPIGLRMVTKNSDEETVHIQLFLRMEDSENWELLVEATDDGSVGNAIIDAGRFGIRTDFMDAAFDDFWVREIKPEAHSISDVVSQPAPPAAALLQRTILATQSKSNVKT